MIPTTVPVSDLAFASPFVVRMNGKRGEGVILKPEGIS